MDYGSAEYERWDHFQQLRRKRIERREARIAFMARVILALVFAITDIVASAALYLLLLIMMLAAIAILGCL